ncbi:hypothetical protein BHE74_00021567 [Ensete ventricosum]|nr:hypothetical protein BHE74_00021567 [Ensete ventricosum]RZR98944.1 hypothetical protein BHM03_00028398 [Ensete ventricosum]
MGNQASLLEVELEKLRSQRDPKQLARAKQQVGELEADNAKLKSGLNELSGQLDEANKELNELREGLVESQRQENESLKVELSSKSIADYKQSIDSDPFIEQPEDGSVPIETRQEFNNSIPPKE